MEQETYSNQSEIKEINISDLLTPNSIVWIEDEKHIYTGRVIENMPNENKIYMFNYDKWTNWLVSYDKIVRINFQYYTDTYREWCKKRLNNIK